MSNAQLTDDKFNEFVSFIRDKAGEHEMIITRESLIEDDLGITGEDADELIAGIAKIYQVDISGFIFKRYFNEEPFIFLPDRKVEPLTIGHLEKGILAGRLDEEVING